METRASIGYHFGKKAYDRLMTQVLVFFAVILAILLIIFIVVVTIASFWRRRDPLPPDMFDGDLPRGSVCDGIYLATYEGDRAHKRTAADFLRGGPGIFYVDEKGVNFLIEGSRQPVHLPRKRILGAAVEEITEGKHKGRKSLAVTWKLEDREYRSIFLLDCENFHSILEDILTSTGGTVQDSPNA